MINNVGASVCSVNGLILSMTDQVWMATLFLYSYSITYESSSIDLLKHNGHTLFFSRVLLEKKECAHCASADL